jgi:tetratricopeptide (TPR) repeat protein
MSNSIEIFKSLLEKGNDDALLRYSLGSEYFKMQDFDLAIIHLNKAIEFNPSYSAAWKLLAKILSEDKQTIEAIKTYEKGIEIAEENGDMQAVKEMRVFLKRLKNS